MPFPPKRPGVTSFTWHDEETPARTGEGVSRTSEKGSKLYRLRVEFKGLLPMIDVVRATSLREAIKFAHNRYPLAVNVVSLEPVRKPRKRKLGEAVHPGQMVQCPRCKKRHKIAEPEEEGQRLLFIRCDGEKIAVALENRYLPQAN